MFSIRKKYPYHLLGFLTFILFLSNCSYDTGSQIINIEMAGFDDEPSVKPSGDSNPHWLKYTINGISLINSDTSETTVVYDGIDPKEAIIINRPQIIFSKDISDLNGNSYTQATFSFTEELKGQTSESRDFTISMASTILSHTEAITVEEGRGLTFDIRLKWKNTVSATTEQEPEYIISYSN